MCACGRACVHWRLLCQGVPETRHGRAGCHRTRNSSSPSFRVSRNVCPLEVRVCLTFEPLGLISLRLRGKGGRGTEETARIWNKSETGDRLWSVAQPHFRHVCFEKQRKKWDSLFFIFLKVYIDGCAVLFPLSINVYKAQLFMAIKNIFFLYRMNGGNYRHYKSWSYTRVISVFLFFQNVTHLLSLMKCHEFYYTLHKIYYTLCCK